MVVDPADATRALLPRPAHVKARVSLLSPDDDSGDSDDDHNENVSYRGFINLGVLILLANNTKDIIKNLRLGGWKADLFVSSLATTPWGVPNHEEMLRWPLPYALMTMVFMSCTAVWLEQLAAKHAGKAKATLQATSTSASKSSAASIPKLFPYLHALNCMLALAVPASLVLVLHPSVASSIVIMMGSVILSMKLVSYAMINSALRAHYVALAVLIASSSNKTKKSKQQQLTDLNSSYPANLTLKNMGMFLLFPTLVYQSSYPRSSHVRPWYVVRRVVELVFNSCLIVVVVQQYVAPGAKRAMAPMNDKDFLFVAERVFALAVPNIYVWLLGFYAFFHVYLNLMAELTRFADRRFYEDWWNSESLDTFWRKWNMPIHNWLKKHLYVPLAIHRGWNKSMVLAFIFFVSGVGHEVILIGVPSHAPVKVWWAFLGMMGQVPLVFITRYLNFGGSRTFGNVVFWVSIFLGQPAGLLMYYYDFSRAELAGSA